MSDIEPTDKTQQDPFILLRERVKKNKIELNKVKTDVNAAGLLHTKATSADITQRLIKYIGIMDATKYESEKYGSLAGGTVLFDGPEQTTAIRGGRVGF